MKPKIKKILVANRGEIALRIIRTCKEMGIHTVAVYSDIDVDLPHVRFADESHCLGGAPARDSYLNQEALLNIASSSGVDAIHPGYGFLAENAAFAKLVGEVGCKFIGPQPEEIKSLGDKSRAREVAASVGVPVVPGSPGTINSTEEAISSIQSIGYPVLLKAAAGGGGKGMRLVRREKDLEAAFSSSRAEAKSAFGDNRIFVEKYIDSPRHVEVQVLADELGNVIHLGERECSIQRRHQKIIEESPCIALNEKQRSHLLDAALQIIVKAGYSNAGTLEFILDEEGKFYFLEMNTRLQVEHPVTEFRTGIDLVREQILVAEGKKLNLRQNDIEFHGNAIEARICAEDPSDDFAPCTGQLKFLQHPHGFGIRGEVGLEVGNVVSSYYDSLLAKLIVWGRTRPEALARLSAALDSYRIFGVKNNLQLCQWVIDHPKFRSGEFDTHFLQEEFHPGVLPGASDRALKVISALAASHNFLSTSSGIVSGRKQMVSKWKLRSRDTLA